MFVYLSIHLYKLSIAKTEKWYHGSSQLITALRGHGHDFGLVLFFCVYYLKCFMNTFLMLK